MFPLWNFNILIRRDIMSTTRIRAIMAELPSTVDGPKLLELVLEAALLLLEPLPKEEFIELSVHNVIDRSFPASAAEYHAKDNNYQNNKHEQNCQNCDSELIRLVFQIFDVFNRNSVLYSVHVDILGCLLKICHW